MFLSISCTSSKKVASIRSNSSLGFEHVSDIVLTCIDYV